jgi:hypothetical protein
MQLACQTTEKTAHYKPLNPSNINSLGNLTMPAGGGKKCRVGKDCPVNRAIIAGSAALGARSLQAGGERLQHLPGISSQQGWMWRAIHAGCCLGPAAML